MTNENSNGEHGVTHHKTTVLTLVYDHETCLVTLGVHDAPCGLLQMMLDEAGRQLDQMRRQAAALELQQRMLEQQKNAAIAAAVNNPTRRQ